MKIKIMAIDDDPAILELFKTLLESLGCEVLGVVDSRKAAARLEVEKVDGLFVDVRMPYMDGFELTKHARQTKLNGQVPIVMLTALDDAETMRKGFELGVSFFLGKPFTRERVYNLFLATRGPMLREQQRYIRLPYRTTVECTWGPYNKFHFKSGSVDISEGGMLLHPSGGLDVNQHVELRFSLPHAAERLKVLARVVRTVPPDGIGLMFQTLTKQDKAAIQQYITARIQD